MDKFLNYTFSFLLIYLFIVEGHADDHLYIILAFTLSFTVSVIAFFLNWVTIDVLHSGTVFGTVLFGLGGFAVALPFLIFFISSSLLTVKREVNNQHKSDFYRSGNASDSRRNGHQVWANGFWIALFVILGFTFETNYFLIPALAALATATADTWSTEIGQYKTVNTYLPMQFQLVAPGTEGGVSTRGLMAGALGSFIIGVCFWLLLPDTGVVTALIIALSGFIGAFVDSILGSRITRKNLPGYQWTGSGISSVERSNNFINFTATGSGSLIALLLTLLFI